MEEYLAGEVCPNPRGCGHRIHAVVDEGFVPVAKIKWHDLSCNGCGYRWVKERSEDS